MGLGGIPRHLAGPPPPRPAKRSYDCLQDRSPRGGGRRGSWLLGRKSPGGAASGVRVKNTGEPSGCPADTHFLPGRPERGSSVPSGRGCEGKGGFQSKAGKPWGAKGRERRDALRSPPPATPTPKDAAIEGPLPPPSGPGSHRRRAAACAIAGGGGVLGCLLLCAPHPTPPHPTPRAVLASIWPERLARWRAGRPGAC